MKGKNIFSLVLVAILLVSSIGLAVPTVQAQEETQTSTPTETPTETSTDTETETESENEETETPSLPDSNENNESGENSENEFDGWDNPKHVFISGMQLKVIETTDEVFKIEIYNPTDQQRIIMVTETAQYEQPYIIDSNSTRIITYQVQTDNLFSNNIVVAESLSQDRIEQIAESGGNTNDRMIQLTHDLLVFNAFPSVPFNLIILGLGTMSTISTMIMFMLKLGTGRFGIRAINYKGAKSILEHNVSDLSIKANKDNNGADTYREMFKNGFYTMGRWMYHNGLIIIHASIIIAGFCHFFNFGLFNTEILNGMMVWYSYGIIAGLLPTFVIAWYFIRTRFKVLHDIEPKAKGDIFQWHLSPSVFSELTVFRKTQDEDGNLYFKEVDKDMLAEINPQTKRQEFEVEGYDPVNNVAVVTWAGVSSELNPNKIRKHKNMVTTLSQLSSHLKTRLENVKDFYKIDVQTEAQYLMAKNTAMIEGELYEDYDDVHERIEERMEERNEEEILNDEEAGFIQRTLDKLKSDKDEDLETETEKT